MGCNSSKAPDYPDGTTKAPAVEDPKATPAIEPASVQPTIPAPDAADEPEEAPVEYKLAADRLAKVQQIFKLWDFNETGKLELSEFTGITVQMGPHESKVLSTLSEMDFDGDGNVVPSEWEQYFAMTCSTLDDAEFGVLIGDIEEAGSTLVTVLQCTQIAKSASTEAAAPAAEPSAEEAAEAAEEEAAAAPTPLTAARQAAVEELFAAWDVEKKGCIPVGQLQQGKLSFGPQTTGIFDALEAMDADGDDEVTLTEMLTYFTVVGEAMSDEQFEVVRSEMLTAAQDATLIASLTAIAASQQPAAAAAAAAAAAPTAAADEEEEEEEAAEFPPLTEARTALLQQLYGVFATDADKSTILMSGLTCDAKIELGPATFTPLEFMEVMDENKDGKVTFAEMCAYFTVVGAELDDASFDLIVNEMIDAASTKKLLEGAMAANA